MEQLSVYDEVEWAPNCLIMPIALDQQVKSYHPYIQEIISKDIKIFDSIPYGVPPKRGIEHVM